MGAVGPAIVSAKGECQNPGKYLRVRSALHGYYWNMLLPKCFQSAKYKDWVCQEEDGFCDYVSGSFFMIKREIFVEAKGFDPATFLYMEMPILSMRLEKCGYRMYYTKQAQILHVQRPTANPLGAPFKNLRFDYQSKQHFYINYGHLSMIYASGALITFEIFFSLFWIKKTFLNLLGIRE